MSDNPRNTKGTPIRYREIIEQDGYVTGIAEYIDPEGQGIFKIYVSGQRDAIQQYEADAVILDLKIIPTATDQTVKQDTIRGLERQIIRLERQSVALRRLLELEQQPDPIPDETRLELETQAGEYLMEHHTDSPNLDRDRLIEIEILEGPISEPPYTILFSIDPPVAENTCDIYAYKGSQPSTVYASIAIEGGDPDTYLYRGGNEKDHAEGGDTDVYGSGGAGTWRLHIFGREAGTSYKLDKSDRWKVNFNDQSNSH